MNSSKLISQHFENKSYTLFLFHFYYLLPYSFLDFENMTMFEISALSPTHISVSLEHPIDESMATAEVNLMDISNLECHIHNPGTPPPANTPDTISELASKILNKCLSLPVTMRTIIKLWEKQAMRRTHYCGGHENFSLPLGPGDPGGHKGGPGPSLGDFGGLGDKMIKQEPMGGSVGHGMMMQAAAVAGQGMFLNESMMASNFPNFPPSDGVLTNMELTNILSGELKEFFIVSLNCTFNLKMRIISLKMKNVSLGKLKIIFQ